MGTSNFGAAVGSRAGPGSLYEAEVQFFSNFVVTAKDGSEGVLLLAQGWGVSSPRLPERLASSLQPLFDLRFINRLVPSYSAGALAMLCSNSP